MALERQAPSHTLFEVMEAHSLKEASLCSLKIDRRFSVEIVKFQHSHIDRPRGMT